MRARFLQFFAGTLFVTSCMGCGDSPVADDLAQREANQIVAELRDHGIEAVTDKERGSKGRYSVSVPSAKFGEAASILSELGLPSEKQPSFIDLVAPSGLLPSSREVEALRLDRAAASEVEILLGQHPAVASVGAVVRVRSIQSGDSPSVSVVIQKRAGSQLDEPPLREIIARAVPGMKPENIVVTIAEQRALPASHSGDTSELVPFLVFWRVPQGDYGGLSLILLGLLVGISALAGVAGYIYGQYSLSRQADAMRLDAIEAGRQMPTISGPLKGTRGDEPDDVEEDKST